MALEEIQKRREIVESRARIREFVFGIQDGLISTVGLLAGVQGATENNVVVVITGLTSMFAGAVSMATGSYLSSTAQKQIFDKELHEAEALAERLNDAAGHAQAQPGRRLARGAILAANR